MRFGIGWRMAGVAAIATVAMATLVAMAPAASVSVADAAIRPSAVRNGEADFVVSHIAYAVGPDAAKSTACPNGLAAAPLKPGAPAAGPDGKPLGPPASRIGPTGLSVCMHPEASARDPFWRSVTGPDLTVEGIDLDGQVSGKGKRPAPGTCAHDDFRGVNGERGVDNQYYRAIGCTYGFQTSGQGNSYEIEMYTGSWGILVSLKGVHDLRNSDNVEVGIYANGDPIQLSPTRAALSYATYAVDHDPRYRATTHGRIVDGVLTTDPVDVRFHWIVNSMRIDRPLSDARLRVKLTPDGGMDGYLAGYTPIVDMYDLQYGIRTAKDAKGQLASEPRRLQVALGSEGALGHTCNGAWYALHDLADGHRDPATGHCTAISTQYRIHLVPAFVVDVPTASVNSPVAIK